MYKFVCTHTHTLECCVVLVSKEIFCVQQLLPSMMDMYDTTQSVPTLYLRQTEHYNNNDNSPNNQLLFLGSSPPSPSSNFFLGVFRDA